MIKNIISTLVFGLALMTVSMAQSPAKCCAGKSACCASKDHKACSMKKGSCSSKACKACCKDKCADCCKDGKCSKGKCCASMKK